jgi:hypothetical protein
VQPRTRKQSATQAARPTRTCTSGTDGRRAHPARQVFPPGGFRFQILALSVAVDDPYGLSCSAHGCTLVGGKNDNDGRGGPFDGGSTLAWRSGPGTSFAPQVTPPPPAAVGGS